MSQQTLSVDICIIGGGSGGYAAALTAAQCGLSVALVEAQDKLGGTSTQAYVSNWASSPSGLPQSGTVDPTLPGYSLSQQIYAYMKQNYTDQEFAITSWFKAGATLPDGKVCSTNTIWALNPAKAFEDTLLEYKKSKGARAQVTFLPNVLHNAVLGFAAELTTPPTILLATSLTSATSTGGMVTSVTVTDSSGDTTVIDAATFVDSTGNLALCAMLDPSLLLKWDNTPPPPTQPPLNLISMCFRLTPGSDSISEKGWQGSGQITQLPGGDYMINPLSELPGMDYFSMSHDTLVQTANSRSMQCWTNLKKVVLDSAKNPFFSGYKLESMAPFLGLRETYRLNAVTILSQEDCLTPISEALIGQETDFIALADHNFDIISNYTFPQQVEAIYGVPYGSLLPQGWSNLLVACRGAGLDHIAASSCRLERVMMQFGQAAGMAAWLAKNGNTTVSALAGSAVADALHMNGESGQIKYYYDLMVSSPSYGYSPTPENAYQALVAQDSDADKSDAK